MTLLAPRPPGPTAETAARTRWPAPAALAFVAVEAVAATAGIPVAAAGHAVLVLVLLNLAVFDRSPAARAVAAALALASASRVAAFGLPLVDVSAGVRAGAAGLPVAVAALAAVRHLDLPAALAPRSRAAWLVVGAGVPLGVAAGALLDAAPGTAATGPAAVAGLTIGAAAEQLLFTGLVRTAVARLAGPATGIATGAVLFASTYLGGWSAAFTALVLGTGLLFGWWADRFGAVAPVAAAHAVLSAVAVGVVGG